MDHYFSLRGSGMVTRGPAQKANQFSGSGFEKLSRNSPGGGARLDESTMCKGRDMTQNATYPEEANGRLQIEY